ncbi:DUF1311 domain-containing protein [filamentous cyanobacterium LEGE 11480]|uniref:DUF1311 domain-containing protein n=1 Tax=Romeriopsis navalis LEGE 11480 TaxID=2777977 RepID=A0A928Z3W7_9CYAN|nr:lysozyme inhibitor LprI family protein [Romeriopsis navalis]MBE9031114.1 DUF1311 domain-containing protein [Romeriopsis navalis LEGE 11480]
MLKRLIPLLIGTALLTGSSFAAQAKPVFQLKPKPGVAQPYCVDKGQIFLNRCAANWYNTADFLRQQLVKDYTVGFDPETTAEFTAIQANWTAFRDEHCELAALQVKGGSLHPLVYNSCRAKLTNDRIADLQKWAPYQRPDLIVFQLLEGNEQKLLQKLKGGELYRKSETLWRNYRDAHCQFERAQSTDATPTGVFAAKPASCENRLAQLRSKQIEPLIDLDW